MSEFAGKKTVYSIPIGPIHPALKEPIQFSFTLDGEVIKDVDVKAGWVHRGIEKLGMGRNPIQILYLAERICGICSVSHTLAFSLAVENALGIEVPKRADYIRTIIAELERIHSHILWAGVAAHELGFDTLLHITWNMRENVLDLLEYLTGNRINYAMLMIGGVRKDIAEEQYRRIIESLEYYKSIQGQLIELFLRDRSIAMRTKGVGILTRQEAIELCAVGPTARASGVQKDVRYNQPYSAYRDIPVEPILPDAFYGEINGDTYDRIVVRVLEVGQSVEIIEKCLENIPQGEIVTEPNPNKLLRQFKKEEGEGIGRHEAPRGELFHYIKFKAGEEAPVAWKVKAPTYSNLMSWIPMLQGQQIADIPIVAASIDPCIACMDRVLVRKENGDERIWTKKELLKLSQEKSNDFFFSCLSRKKDKREITCK